MKKTLSISTQKHIEELIFERKSRIGVSVQNISGVVYGFSQDEIFDTACGIMAFIMAEYYRQYEEGIITGQERLIYTEENYATGAGTIKHASFGAKIIAKDALYLMIAISDHIAANLIVDLLGINNINMTIKKLGYANTRLNCKFLIPKVQNVGSSTPAEFAHFYNMLQAKKILSGKSCDSMLDLLRKQRYKDILTDAIRSNTSLQFIDVASKSGKADGRMNKINSYLMDSGIIFTGKGEYAIALFADIPVSTESLEENKKTLNQISLAIFNDLVSD